jgi:hypothetical protein
MSPVARYSKAIVAFLVAFASLYSAATAADSPGGTGVSSNEWVRIVVTGLISGFAVWGYPNAPEPPPVRPTPDTVTTVNVGPAAIPSVAVLKPPKAPKE